MPQQTSYLTKTVCFILGGGKGNRLSPLTQHRAKPAVSILGNYRLIDIPISNCLNASLNKIFVLTQYNAASINSYIKDTYHFDGFGDGYINILSAEQTSTSSDWYAGTADAVRQTLSYIDNTDVQHVIILSGDQLYRMDFQKMLRTHIKSRAEISIASIAVREQEASRFGILKVEKGGRITDFIEKPDSHLLPDWKSDIDSEPGNNECRFLASMGIYIFNVGVLRKILTEQFPTGNDFGKDIIPPRLVVYKTQNYLFKGYWKDLGTIPSFLESNIELVGRPQDLHLYVGNKKLYGRPSIYPPARILQSRLDNSLISDGCMIENSTIAKSIIGPCTYVQSRSRIRNCYILGQDHFAEGAEKKTHPYYGIGKNCVLENVIVDEYATIGNNVRIVGHQILQDMETDQYAIRDGIVVVKRNATIPGNTTIGVNDVNAAHITRHLENVLTTI